MNININTSTQRRLCSFCREPGHNISNCNHDRFRSFEDECISFCQTHSPYSREFADWLYYIYLMDRNIIRAYAIRHCGCTSRSNISAHFNAVKCRIRQLLLDPDTVSYTQNMDNDETNNVNTNTVPVRTNGNTFMMHINEDYIMQRNMSLSHRIIAIREAMMGRLSLPLLNKNIKCEIVQAENDAAEEMECNICYETIEHTKFIKLECGHEFCKDCIKKTLKNETSREFCSCAFCRKDIKTFKIYDEYLKEEFADYIM